MNEQEAIELAQKTADLHGWVMAVYFNPYAILAHFKKEKQNADAT